MKEFFKTLGAIFLVVGTCIGGGMLAVPMVTAACGFWWSMVIFAFCWAVMLYSCLLVLEVNSALPARSSFSSMARATLGLPGKLIMWAMFLLLLYALLAAYDTGGASLLQSVFLQLKLSLGYNLSALLFTVLLGAVVFFGIRLTEFINRYFLAAKLLFFVLAAVLMMPHVDVSKLNGIAHNKLYLLTPIPIVLVSFGSHFVIPSIRSYIGPDPKRLRKIIFIGMLIPLLVYIVWQVLVFGVLPKNGAYSFASIAAQQNTAGSLVMTLAHYFQSHLVKTLLNAFVDIAMTTSFLGIALSLFDFFIDGLTLNSSVYAHRFIAAVLTFVLPFMFAIFYPNGFIMALSYGAVFAAVLVLILPALMSMRLAPKGLKPFYPVFGGRFLRVLILLVGVFIICLHFLL